MLAAIGQSDVTFIRNGKAYRPLRAEQHIRTKYEFVKDEINSVDSFIDRVASISWTTDRRYVVRLPDGVEMPADRWLRQRLQQIEASEDAPPKKATTAPPEAESRQ